MGRSFWRTWRDHWHTGRFIHGMYSQNVQVIFRACSRFHKTFPQQDSKVCLEVGDFIGELPYLAAKLVLNFMNLFEMNLQSSFENQLCYLTMSNPFTKQGRAFLFKVWNRIVELWNRRQSPTEIATGLNMSCLLWPVLWQFCKSFVKATVRYMAGYQTVSSQECSLSGQIFALEVILKRTTKVYKSQVHTTLMGDAYGGLHMKNLLADY